MLPALPPAAVFAEEDLPEEVVAHLAATRAAIRSHALHEARAHIDAALRDAPTSFTAHAMNGEVLYRLGLYDQASAALFAALLQPPTTWANYQLVNHLYQESRARQRGSWSRVTECPPPRPIELAIRWVAGRMSWMARWRRLDVTA